MFFRFCPSSSVIYRLSVYVDGVGNIGCDCGIWFCRIL